MRLERETMPIHCSSIPNLQLRSTSPAIDTAEPGSGGTACPSDDHRTEARDDLRCDIGAYEVKFDDSNRVAKSNLTTNSFGPTLVKVAVNSGNPGTVTVTKHDQPPGGGSPDSGEMPVYWNINPTGGTYNLDLTLCYTDNELGSLTESALRIYRWDGSSWIDQGSTTVDEANNCVSKPGVTQLSSWTLGTSTPSGAPAAVKLLFPAHLLLLL